MLARHPHVHGWQRQNTHQQPHETTPVMGLPVALLSGSIHREFIAKR
jgi:hypothetical protein